MAEKISPNKKAAAGKDMSEELGQLERYIHELSEFLPLPFCIANPTGVILNINKAFSDLTGYRDLEIVGERTECLFEDKKGFVVFEEKILKEDSIVEREEMNLITKDGNKIAVNVSGSLRKDQEGNSIGYFLAFSDISEFKKLQKQLEEKVEERTKQLREKINEMERFNRLAIGREIKMVELKGEIKKIKERLGEEKK